MIALIIEHIETEGPGTLGEFLTRGGYQLDYARLHEGYDFSGNPTDYDLIVSMGGPMNVYEEEKYPFLAKETVFLREAVSEGSNVIGICLGAQMIAKCCGASVTQSPMREVGWGTVTLTSSGLSDKIFEGVKNPLTVFQWHEDMFDIPQSGILLAQSQECPHQAFRINRAYGFQFHVEVDENILDAWFHNSHEKESILNTYHDLADELKEQSELIYGNLLKLIDG